MALIKYENPQVLAQSNKPVAIENKSFPYNLIADSRRFEELIYTLYKAEIEEENFEGFDGISLMSGVREKGRDCALFKNGKNHGLIQCKKYEKSYSKEDFGLEIIKFGLYSLLESKLINDVRDFTYYIAVSNGFVLECSDFIDDFNNSISLEFKLDKWIQKNIAKPTLKSLSLKDPKDELLKILTKIKVKKIFPVDIDRLLSKDINYHIASLFFQVRTVTDNSVIERLEKKD